jgi:heme/copper-type cytochrome/quinol oxidase subunit 2
MNSFSSFIINGLIRNDTTVENYYFTEHILKESNSLLLKSQQKPIKKGIANMIKLHSTGAIALPIEMKVQLLASSRDVIHS